MDIDFMRALIAPLVQVFSSLIVSGGTVAVATQLLKLDWFPVAVSRYPRLTSVVLSVLASIISIYVSGVNFVFVTPLDYIGFTMGTLVLSAFTYRTVLKGTLPSKDGRTSRL